MIEQWLATSWTETWLVVVSALVAFGAIVLYTRIAGLRTFSKMSAFDFAATLAIGSSLATIAITDASLSNGLIGLATIYVAQVTVAFLRRRAGLQKVVDNDPVLLMLGRELLEDNLQRTHVTRSDVWAKLREANVTDYDQILAVILETTGDVSVLHGDGPLEPGLLDGVQGAPATS